MPQLPAKAARVADGQEGEGVQQGAQEGEEFQEEHGEVKEIACSKLLMYVLSMRDDQVTE